VNISQPYGEVIASNDPSQPETLAVVGDRRLPVAALVALLLKDVRRSVVRVARGRDDVRATLLEFQPAVIVIEASSVEWPLGLDPHSWGGRTLLLLGPEDDPGMFRRLAPPAADGFLSCTGSYRALEGAIDTVACAAAMGDLHGEPAQADRALSEREREILGHISSGHSSKEIARRCGIQTKTVRNHVSNVYAKLHLHHRGQLVLYAAQHRDSL
jgi:DNA-binding CsgD family transcriptional regulator